MKMECTNKEDIKDNGENFNNLIISLSNDVMNYFDNLANEDIDIFGGTEDSYASETFVYNAYENIYNYTQDENVSNKVLNNMLEHIENSKFDNLSADDILRETSKVVINSLKEIKSQQEKKKANDYDR